MRNLALASLLIASLSACGSAGEAGTDAQSQPEVTDDKGALLYTASLRSADGPDAEVGDVRVSDKDGGTLHVALKSMKAGSYAMHFHSVGKCEGPDFKSAGGHWNPEGNQHGRENPKGAHAGDLVNLKMADDGEVDETFELPGNTKANIAALIDDDGAAFVIHAGPDDMKSDPAGDAGSRIICGVFEKGGATE